MTVSLNLIFHSFFPQGTCTSLRDTIYGSLTWTWWGLRNSLSPGFGQSSGPEWILWDTERTVSRTSPQKALLRLLWRLQWGPLPHTEAYSHGLATEVPEPQRSQDCSNGTNVAAKSHKTLISSFCSGVGQSSTSPFTSHRQSTGVQTREKGGNYWGHSYH